MILTQDQANAIAEREFPEPVIGRQQLWPVTLAKRAAYAKCLMDLNPLIEAVSGYERELKNPAVDVTMRTWWRNKMFTALSNLTKK